MPEPVDTADDLLVTRAAEIELVTVESLDPDALAGADMLATATGVRAIAGRESRGETPVGGGSAGQARRNFTLIAGDMTFVVKTRDRITRVDGTKWLVGEEVSGGFGSLVSCPDCVKER